MRVSFIFVDHFLDCEITSDNFDVLGHLNEWLFSVEHSLFNIRKQVFEEPERQLLIVSKQKIDYQGRVSYVDLVLWFSTYFALPLIVAKPKISIELGLHHTNAA